MAEKDKNNVVRLETAEPPKPRKRGKTNLPTVFEVNPKDMKKILGMGLVLAKQAPCITEEEMEERTLWYFTWCIENEIKPSVVGYALAMGVHRDTIHAWWKGEQGAFKKHIATRAKDMIEYFMTTSVMENSINPVVWMFYSKNFFGYTDVKQVELSATPIGMVSEEEQSRIIKQLPDDFD